MKKDCLHEGDNPFCLNFEACRSGCETGVRGFPAKELDGDPDGEDARGDD